MADQRSSGSDAYARLVQEFARSPSAGERLAAAVLLQERPSIELLDWLVQTLTDPDGHEFVAAQAALALETGVARLVPAETVLELRYALDAAARGLAASSVVLPSAPRARALWRAQVASARRREGNNSAAEERGDEERSGGVGVQERLVFPRREPVPPERHWSDAQDRAAAAVTLLRERMLALSSEAPEGLRRVTFLSLRGGRVRLRREAVRGHSLLEKVSVSDFAGRFSERSARHWAGGLLRALEAVHTAGFVHGAISPTSVLISSDGDAVLTGWEWGALRWDDDTYAFLDIRRPARRGPPTQAEDVAALGEVLHGASSSLRTIEPRNAAWAAFVERCRTPGGFGSAAAALASLAELDATPKPPGRKRVFLSGNPVLFPEARALVRRLVGSRTGIEVFGWEEYQEIEPGAEFKGILRHVPACDLYLGLVDADSQALAGKYQGTRKEFDAARRAGIPCLLYVRKLLRAFDAQDGWRTTLGRSTAELAAGAGVGLAVQRFRTLDELAEHVDADITTLSNGGWPDSEQAGRDDASWPAERQASDGTLLSLLSVVLRHFDETTRDAVRPLLLSLDIRQIEKTARAFAAVDAAAVLPPSAHWPGHLWRALDAVRGGQGVSPESAAAAALKTLHHTWATPGAAGDGRDLPRAKVEFVVASWMVAVGLSAGEERAPWSEYLSGVEAFVSAVATPEQGADDPIGREALQDDPPLVPNGSVLSVEEESRLARVVAAGLPQAIEGRREWLTSHLRDLPARFRRRFEGAAGSEADAFRAAMNVVTSLEKAAREPGTVGNALNLFVRSLAAETDGDPDRDWLLQLPLRLAGTPPTAARGVVQDAPGEPPATAQSVGSQGTGRRPRVFISGNVPTLGQHRATAIRVVEESGAEPVAVETFRASGVVALPARGRSRTTNLTEHHRRVAECDLLVCLVGWRYGAGGTVGEYREARKCGVPCLAYLYAGEPSVNLIAAEAGGRARQEGSESEALEAFKTELRSAGHLVREYATPQELEGALRADLLPALGHALKRRSPFP